MNCNFTNWYEVKNNSNVLIVDKTVESIEKYKKQKYDYIYLNGILENAEKIMCSKKPEIDLINFFKALLCENGKMFIAVDNKMGVKYLSGDKSEHCNNIYDSLKNQFSNGKLFSKTELDKIVEESNFKHKRYYYPLPNYENISVIYTDEMLPNKNDSKINYNIVYDEGSLIVKDEISLLKTFIEEGQFVNFTNSYIIELSNSEIDKKVKYYSFNSMRKEKYSLVLKMKDDYVEKYPKTDEAIEHIRNIKNNSKKLTELGFKIAEEFNEEDIVKSKFINLKSLDKQIVDAIEKEEYENVYELINNWYKYIKEKLKVNKEGIVKDGFIDLTFENTFFDNKNNEYIFFDQEWYEENIPIKFILMRALKNLYEYNPNIERKLNIKDLFEKYALNEYVEEFIQKEKRFQEDVLDKDKQEFYGKQYDYKITSEEIKRIIRDIKKLDKDNVELIEEIKRLQSNINEKNNNASIKTILQRVKRKFKK